MTQEQQQQDELDNLPRDAILMSLLMKSMDITQYDKQTIPQLLEFAHSMIHLNVTLSHSYTYIVMDHNPIMNDTITLH